MKLSDVEIGCIGTSDECLNEHTELRRIAKIDDGVFDCLSYTFKVEKGYKRYVPFSLETISEYIENDEIRKYRDGSGFFPTYMCEEGIFEFLYQGYAKEHAEYLKKHLGEYLDIIWGPDQVLKIRVRDPVIHLIEFDFYPHNMGPYINIIARIQN